MNDPAGRKLADQVHRALAQGALDEAISLAERAPMGPARSRWLAHALMTRRREGDLQRARSALRDWTHRLPRDPEPWRRLVEIGFHQGRLDEAEELIEAFATRSAAAGDSHYYRGVLYQLRHETGPALDAYDRAIAARRAAAGQEPLGEQALAVAAAMQLYEVASGNFPGSPHQQPEGLFDHPNVVECLENRLLAWESKPEGAAPETGSELSRTHADAWYNLGCAAMAGFSGHPRAARCFGKALHLEPGHVLARLNAVFVLNYSDTRTAQEIFAAHRETGIWLEQQFGGGSAEFNNDRRRDRRLRLGYLSSDFRAHSVAHFILPVLQAHDPESFDRIAYHTNPLTDACTRRVRDCCTVFRPVADKSLAALRQQIIDDRIDVLIDLNGLTKGHRMPLLAMRAAPVQINWIGYPNTTGLGTVDYRMVDAITDPPGMADALAVERLVRLPKVFSVYEPPAEAPSVQPPPCRSTGTVTFGSFNAMPKLNEALLRTWAGILEQVAGSRLLIKNVALGFEAPRREILQQFAQAGIPAGRIELAGHTASQFEHLAYFHRVDICLDAFPYNGTTTTCDSLFMGVPVVTRAGQDHRSRVAASQLTALGLESLVASDENSTIEIAAGLAADTNRLVTLRGELRGRLLNSPLTDANAFTRDLENALRQIWAHWCGNEEAL